MLSRADYAAVLEFLGDAAYLVDDEAYSPALFTMLGDLIPHDGAAYQEFEYAARRHCLLVGFDQNGPFHWGTASGEPPPPDEEDEIYWRVGPCPIIHYRVREHSLDAVRMSDVVSLRRYRELPIYRDYFRNFGIEFMLDLGLPPSSVRDRSLVLMRRREAGDFTERERAVLELLRRHLMARELQAAQRRRLVESLSAPEDARGDEDGLATLTPREREIVDLVAEGWTNAEIAARLWVAPSTVKKHLEHVYAKLGVGRRAAVAARRG